MDKQTVIILDCIGIIQTGEDSGQQIKVSKSDFGDGYYLFMSNDFSNTNCDVFDHQYDSLEAIEDNFKESGWVISWKE